MLFRSGQGAQGAVAGRAATIQAGTKPCQYVDQVTHQIIGRFTGIHHGYSASLGRESSLYVLGAEPCETIAVLHNDRGHLGISKEAHQPSPAPVRPEPTSASVRETAYLCCPAHAVSRAICRSRSARWSCEETRAYTAAAAAGWPDGSVTRIVLVSSCCAGTGSTPRWNHR